jgi:cullin-associated NEDD8-dissociated protein 1
MSGSSSTASINALLKKTEHYDKDERYMATSDLCEVLKRHSSGDTLPVLSDSSTERRICTAVLRLLHDKSNDVQAIAVKTLGVLLTTVKEEQVLEIADSLADQVLDASKSELRDVYAIGLRTLVKTIPSSMGDLTSQRLVGRLLDGIRTSQNEEIVLACLDILTDLLGRFGATAVSVTRQHEPILQMCLQQLTGSSPVVRKRAGNTIGCLSVVLSDVLLVSMVERLLSQIDAAAGNPGDTRALIRTMCTVSGAVGHRLQQPQIDRILPIFLKFTNPEDALTGDDDEFDDHATGQMSGSDDLDMEDEAAVALANELRESCFMGFESFVLRCPTQVEPHLEKIIQASLAYMCYDPNYSYGDDDDENNEEGEDESDDEYDDEYEDEESEDEDDDDESWKVRRSAIRSLKAVVEAKKHDPSVLWTNSYQVRRGKAAIVAMALVGRFKEREENCRVDILDCFTQLLSVTVNAAEAGVVAFAGDDMDTSTAVTIDLRTNYAPSLVKACEKLLSVKKGGERSKSNALSLLSTLCKAPGGVGGQQEITSVFQYIQSFLADEDNDALHREASSKTLRLDALSLVHVMLVCNNHDPVHIRKGLTETLLPQLCQAVKEQWYKVIAEALRALAAVPRFFVIGFRAGDQSTEEQRKEMDDVANQLFAAIEPLLAAHDVDQEIKECALAACAALLSALHSNMSSDQTTSMLNLLLDRLKNETTRIAAIKTLSVICDATPDSAEDKIDLNPILAESIETMASFLKLQSRSLKQSSLEALDIVVTNHGLSDSNELYSKVLQDLSHLVVDSDLHISHLSL